MAFFTEQRLESRLRKQFGYSVYESETRLFSKAETLLRESLEFQETAEAKIKTYDIFLSHSTKDAKKVAGLKLEIEDMGYSVYVDWIEDPYLDRSKVTKETALVLQERMKNCRSLVYAFSENSSESRWMPWELGYFDGIKKKVAVLPISNKSGNSFYGTEYLGIYYYITVAPSQGSTKDTLWVRESDLKYVIFSGWLNNDLKPVYH